MSPRLQVEAFHLMFLRQFHSLVSPSLYAIKGGCNLRFFFDSIRYSEDLDIDVQTIQKQTLENKINKILSSLTLLRLLQGYGVTKIDFTSPKQTQTTQRWKIQLHSTTSTLPLHTKIEFSRRQGEVSGQLDDISIRICRLHRLPPSRLSHYNIQEAIAQKIIALANRSLTQARDIFDLYHLLHLETPKKLTIDKNTLPKAQEALLSINFDDYKSQVVNFLEAEQQNTYGDKHYWTTLSTKVLIFLEELQNESS